MNENLIAIIKKIIQLPIELKKNGNDKSIYTLLKETGYFNIHESITSEKISHVLIDHLDSIEHWLAWSEDKRTEYGCYFIHESENNKYIVGRVSINSKDEYLEFHESINACATFIKIEIENIRIS